MTGAGNSILIPLESSVSLAWGVRRRREPVTTGIPLPRGLVRSASDVELVAPTGTGGVLQARVLDRWSDGSIRWLLLDFLVDAVAGRAQPMALRIQPDRDGPRAEVSPASAFSVKTIDGGVEVATGRGEFRFLPGGRFPFSQIRIDGADVLESSTSGFQIALAGRAVPFVIRAIELREAGPVRAEIDLQAVPQSGADASGLEVFGRVELFADSATARVEIAIRNPRRARHPGGQWTLGDPGSVLIESAELRLATLHEVAGVRAAPEAGQSLQHFDLPFTIHQESSGGGWWQSPAHKNRDGVVPLRFRGYRVLSGDGSQTALRATPIVVADAGSAQIAVAVPQFWEQFPRSLAVNGHTISIGFFPRDAADPYELLGGEQKTHRATIAFAPDPVSDPPLSWCHDPVHVFPSPDWCCGTGAVPHLVPALKDSNTAYLNLIDLAFDSQRGFLAKRERFDEYGWRHFGDLPADHESAFQHGDQPFISHYNNQYDAIAGCAMHYLRTGDPRWRSLMDDLARHVRDIDIYHTREDKAAYNGGLFWHTYHYVDAGTSTHRTYPTGISAGGGPSAEHNYTVGLMLHHFLTGELSSRDAVVGLARWVVDMDDGRLTPFRWLASGATGLASATGSLDYHGPGRGAANSIVACLTACRLTSDPAFVRKADELILRCIHPHDDLQARNLLDTERRWYYTVFLQALGRYLEEKGERREIDEMYGYAQASLLHYARWMARHEVPYLERPEILEYPTETWAAQDMRKAEVLWWAACHANGQERDWFLKRAGFFFDYAVSTLSAMETRHFTRPLVLLLSNGVRAAWAARMPPVPAPAGPIAPAASATPLSFEPQKLRAIRRARWIAIGGLAGMLILLLGRVVGAL